MGFDDDVLELVVTRRPALAALADEPHHRRELQAALDVSKTTCHRIIRSFEEEGLLRRTDQGYELTELGAVVETQVSQLDSRVRTAYRLAPLLDAFGSADVSLDIDLFVDATVTLPEPDDPSPPINRFLELFRDADTIRTLDRTSFTPPLYVEEILESDRRGVAVFPKSVVEKRYSKYPELHRKIAESGAPVRYRVYDDVPFGMTVYDEEHVGLRAYDDETGALRLFVDTDDPEAVNWAIDVFEYYYERSERPAAFETLPDWVPESDIRL